MRFPHVSAKAINTINRQFLGASVDSQKLLFEWRDNPLYYTPVYYYESYGLCLDVPCIPKPVPLDLEFDQNMPEEWSD